VRPTLRLFILELKEERARVLWPLVLEKNTVPYSPHAELQRALVYAQTHMLKSASLNNQDSPLKILKISPQQLPWHSLKKKLPVQLTYTNRSAGKHWKETVSNRGYVTFCALFKQRTNTNLNLQVLCICMPANLYVWPMGHFNGFWPVFDMVRSCISKKRAGSDHTLKFSLNPSFLRRTSWFTLSFAVLHQLKIVIY